MKAQAMDETLPVIEVVARVVLDGELAAAYEEFRAASADLEGKVKAAQAAQERYQSALGRLSRLSAKADPQ